MAFQNTFDRPRPTPPQPISNTNGIANRYCRWTLADARTRRAVAAPRRPAQTFPSKILFYSHGTVRVSCLIPILELVLFFLPKTRFFFKTRSRKGSPSPRGPPLYRGIFQRVRCERSFEVDSLETCSPTHATFVRTFFAYCPILE